MLCCSKLFILSSSVVSATSVLCLAEKSNLCSLCDGSVRVFIRQCHFLSIALSILNNIHVLLKFNSGVFDMTSHFDHVI